MKLNNRDKYGRLQVSRACTRRTRLGEPRPRVVASLAGHNPPDSKAIKNIEAAIRLRELGVERRAS